MKGKKKSGLHGLFHQPIVKHIQHVMQHATCQDISSLILKLHWYSFSSSSTSSSAGPLCFRLKNPSCAVVKRVLKYPVIIDYSTYRVEKNDCDYDNGDNTHQWPQDHMDIRQIFRDWQRYQVQYSLLGTQTYNHHQFSYACECACRCVLPLIVGSWGN